MSGAKRELLKIYKGLDYDWMNYKICRKEDLTYHHIIKRCEGGEETVDNGALLIRLSHDYLHRIEMVDRDYYDLLNKMFLIINRQRDLPDEEQRGTVEYILRMFEREHKNDKTSRGKQLIKKEYIDQRSYFGR